MSCGLSFTGPMTAAEAREMGYGSWVYVIYFADGRGPKYVGQSSNLATRFTNHPKWSPNDSVYVAAVDAARRLIEERRLIAELNPPMNRTAGRPKKPPELNQTAALTIRMTKAERALIDQVGGSEPGVWARETLLRVARRILGKNTEKPEQ